MSMTAGVVGKPIAALLARVAQILERRDGCWFRDVTRFGLAAITYFNNGRDISGRCKRNASLPLSYEPGPPPKSRMWCVCMSKTVPGERSRVA